MRRLLILSALATVCAVAGGSSLTYTLIVDNAVELGPLQGVPANILYTAISGATGDLNGDGLPDIVLGLNGAAPAVYLNNGTANPFQGVSGVLLSSTDNVQSAFLGDLNGDGHLDIAAVGFNTPNKVYLNNGTAAPFAGGTGVSIGTGDVSFALALGDVNGDGFPDMAVANTNHILSRIYLTNGAPLTSGTYSTADIGSDVGYGQDIRIVDVNGDGKPDLVIAYEYFGAGGLPTDPSGVAIYLNNGTNSPFDGVTPLRLLQGQSIVAIAIGDINNDQKPDLVVSTLINGESSNGIFVLLNTGSSTQPYYASQTLAPDKDLGGVCVSVSIADLNGDGLPDLVFSCDPPAPVNGVEPANAAVGAIYLNNGTGAPFEGVAAIDIPATSASGYGRSTAVATFVKGGSPSVLIAEGPGLANYFPLTLDQNPAAQDDAAVCAVNKTASINVLTNDTAGPGQSLSKTSVSITTMPAHGTASVDAATGLVTYQPAQGYVGSDAFNYTVRDGLGAVSNVATVTVRVQPAPVANNDTSTIQANTSTTINVLANDTSAGGSLDASTLKIVVAPAHGTASITNGGNGVIYTPASGYSGLDTFQYTVSDNLETVSNAATVSIEITAPPAAHGGGAIGAGSLLGLIGLMLARRFRETRSASVRIRI